MIGTMPPQLASAVEDRLETPRSGETVSLIVGVTKTSDEVIASVEATGATVEQRLFYDSLAVSVAEEALDELCGLEVVETVEIEGQWKQLDAENFRTQADSIL
jgi:uncharacterized protein YcfL